MLSGYGVIGVDLAGSPRRVTGLCYLDSGLRCVAARARLDDEILVFVQEMRPRLIAIDAPLSFPPAGRSMRCCDEELKKLGLRPLPPILGPMKMLTSRAIELKKIMQSLGYEVIEVFPSGARRILKLPSKKMGASALRESLLKLGVRGIPEDVDEHVLDAVICALVGVLYLRGRYVKVGDPNESMIILPKPIE